MDKKTFDLIDKIASEHSFKTFGYLTREDLKNEIWIIALEKLPEYNKKRGRLEHFLRTSVRNRLINKFKDITKSVRSPCPRCKYYDPENSPSACAKFGNDKHLCNKWKNYQLSVKSRNSLLNSVEQQNNRLINSSSLDSTIIMELKDIIFSNIHKSFLMDFNTLISNGKISKNRLKKLKKEIYRIIEEYQNGAVSLTINGKIIDGTRE